MHIYLSHVEVPSIELCLVVLLYSRPAPGELVNSREGIGYAEGGAGGASCYGLVNVLRGESDCAYVLLVIRILEV